MSHTLLILGLIINQAMQSNVDCIYTPDTHEFPDSWVELTNEQPEAINLHNYRIGLQANASTAYRLPSQTIQAGDSILVFCDKENRGLHTPFRLDEDGCKVYLFHETQLIDSLILPKQPAPQTVYRQDSAGWHYEVVPGLTPQHTTLPANRCMTLPIWWIVTDSAGLYSPEEGIYVVGNDPDHPNYKENWRRPASIEYFPAGDTVAALRQLGELRIQGGNSRNCALKSMILYAHKRFGAKHLKYEFFPDQRPGEKQYKSIILRNAGNDFDYLYMRDAIMQRTIASGCDVEWQAWQPSVVYINGEYKGILNIRERSNEDNIYTNYDKLEDIDLIDGWWGASEGTTAEWNRFKTFYKQTGHSLTEYAQQLDWLNFLNVMLCNIYFDNKDFPGNNLNWWRPHQAIKGQSPKWRIMLKDTDFGLGLYRVSSNYNTLYWVMHPGCDPNYEWGNSEEGTILFRHLMDDPDFRNEFIERSAIYVGDFLMPKRICKLWDEMYSVIAAEHSTHRKLFNQWWPNYQDEKQFAQQWLHERAGHYLEHVRQMDNLPQLCPLKINTSLSDTTGLTMRFNGIDLTQPVWDGKYFKQRAIQLETSVTGNKHISGWQIRTTVNGKTNYSYIVGSSLSLQIPNNCSLLEINATVGAGNDLENLPTKQAQKILLNGEVVIVREGKTYSLLGNPK